MDKTFPGFPKETLRFLRALKRNNNRDWFVAHKDVYEESVRGPIIELATAVGGAILNFAPEMVVDPRRNIYRIHRDIRFSQDKSPYKTHVAALFWPRGLEKNACAALYFHLEPAEVLIAGGIYMPGTAELHAIRNHIAANWEQMRKVISAPQFRKLFGGLEGERLSKPPRGFPADHPAIDLLRYKQFLVSVACPPTVAESPALFPRIVTAFAAMMPLIRFLNAPLERSVSVTVR
jgi:uncharacterized protein (TIGR02453 family)